MSDRRSPRIAASLAVAASVLIAGFSAAAEDPKWIALFNGRDLEGWTPKIKGYEAGDNFANTFRVEDGVLKVAYDGYKNFDGKFGHLHSKAKYSHYRLRIEYRFTGPQCPGGPSWATRNSGVMIHSQAAETVRKDQEFPVSIEVQFLGGDGMNPRHTGNVCTPGTHIVMKDKLTKQHCVDSTSKTIPLDGWVTAEVEVHGDGTIKHLIDGEPVIEYEKPQYDESDADARKLKGDGPALIREGHLALQSESHPIEFRKVEILPLSP